MNSIKPNRIPAALGNRLTGKMLRQVATGASLVLLTGCQGAPSINLMGSFFPAWMLCMFLGVVGAFLVRIVCIRTNIEPHLQPRLLVYVCLWGLITLLLWLLVFRS
jgi:hypothetical protein